MKAPLFVLHYPVRINLNKVDVIKKWVSENNPQSLSQLLQAFSGDYHRGGVIVPVAKAKEIYEAFLILYPDNEFADDAEVSLRFLIAFSVFS